MFLLSDKKHLWTNMVIANLLKIHNLSCRNEYIKNYFFCASEMTGANSTTNFAILVLIQVSKYSIKILIRPSETKAFIIHEHHCTKNEVLNHGFLELRIWSHCAMRVRIKLPTWLWLVFSHLGTIHIWRPWKLSNF